jgi:tetratricopeptide (TPR) repeat protein
MDWQQEIRERVARHELDVALTIADRRIENSPADLEAHGWRGRILARKGRFAEAEAEYRYVLQKAPTDLDILVGLADVLLWREQPQKALDILDQARVLAASNPEILWRRARVLLILGRTSEAREEFHELLLVEPQNQDAKRILHTLTIQPRHELRFGEDVDTFNYAGTAGSQSLLLNSRWSPRWSTSIATGFYQRFGEDGVKATASATFCIRKKHWVTLGGAGANDRGVIPRAEAFFEYGDGFRLHSQFVKGLETSYRQHWFWYRGAHVLTISGSETFYLPHDWSWTFTATGARSGFADSGVQWVSSGLTRLAFPLVRQLSGNLFFAVGTENFAQVDQIGHFSSHTLGGGLRRRLTESQDIIGYVAWQQRSQGQMQYSFGLSYGIHF